MTTELARIETITPAELFKPGTLDPILGRIREEVMREAACLDISTEPNRKALASLAYKVAKSKTFIDSQRKKLVAGEKERLKAIDQEGGRIWDELEKLQEEVRKPLTDWENAEKARVQKHEINLAALVEVGTQVANNWESMPVSQMREYLKEIVDDRDHDWQEFHSRAVAAVVLTLGQIREAIARREKLEADRAELEKLRAEQAKRDQQAREERIAREAEEKAKAEADARAVLVAKLAEQARQRAEDEKHAAEARAKQAEAQREQVERQAKAQAEAAAQSAARAAKEAAERQEQAVEAERQRGEDARKAEQAATEKREANKRHVAKINREVRDALMQHTFDIHPLTDKLATQIIAAIVDGLIPHTKITY